jgi:hypothetical protein
MPQQKDATGYAYAVEMDACWLLRKLADPDADVGYAAAALENTAGQVLVGGDVRRFAPDSGQQAAVQDELDVLGATAAELNVAAVLAAASRAMAFGASPAERTDFERVVASLGACRRDLESARYKTMVTAFAPAIEPSPDPATAAGRLREEADRTLETLAVRTAGIVRQALGTAAGCSPGQLGEGLRDLRDLGALGAKLRRVEEKLRGLAELALRLVAHALTRLSRVIPSGRLDEAQARVMRLMDSLGAGNPGGVTAEVLGIPAARQEIAARFADVDPGRWDTRFLDSGTAGLTALTDRFESTMAAMDAVLKGTVVAGDVLGWLPVAMEVRPAVLASVAVVIIAFAVTIGRDCVDSGSVLRFVRGVRQVVAVACGEGT